jgi:hypothetical protein
MKAQEGALMAAPEDGTRDRRASDERPIPTVKLDDAWRLLTDPDAATTADWRARVAAGRRYATRRAATAAQVLRALFPAAHRVVFDLVDEFGRETRVDLLAIRDTAGGLLWHADAPAQHPDTVTTADSEASRGPVLARIDERTREAVEELIADAEETADGFFRRTEDEPYPGRTRRGLLDVSQDPYELVVPDALDQADRLTVDSIGLDRLADLLRRETSVVDPDDVDRLVAVIRAAADAAEETRPAVVVDRQRLAAWLAEDHVAAEYAIDEGWFASAASVAELVTALADDPAGLAALGWQVHPDLTGIYASRSDTDVEDAVIFSADVAGGGRVCTLPLSDRELCSDLRGPSAALQALERVARLLGAACPKGLLSG